MEYTTFGKIMKNNENFFYNILGVFSLNVLTKRRISDMFDYSVAILSGPNEQILFTP